VLTIRTTSLTFSISTFCPHTVFMCFVWIWEQRAIISLYSFDQFLYETFKLSKPSGHYMYHQFNIQQFYVLPTQCIYVFCVDLIKNRIKWLICIRDLIIKSQWSLYVPPVVTICTAQWSLYVPPVKHSTFLSSAHTVYLCVLCGSQNKQRLFPHTTLTDWFL
jgi:hypothetical protein